MKEKIPKTVLRHIYNPILPLIEKHAQTLTKNLEKTDQQIKENNAIPHPFLFLEHLKSAAQKAFLPTFLTTNAFDEVTELAVELEIITLSLFITNPHIGAMLYLAARGKNLLREKEIIREQTSSPS